MAEIPRVQHGSQGSIDLGQCMRMCVLVEEIGLTRQQCPTFILPPQRLSYEYLHHSSTAVLFGLRPGTLGFYLTLFSLAASTCLRLCRTFSVCSSPLGFFSCLDGACQRVLSNILGLSSALPFPHSPQSQAYGNTQANQRQRQLPTDLAQLGLAGGFFLLLLLKPLVLAGVKKLHGQREILSIPCRPGGGRTFSLLPGQGIFQIMLHRAACPRFHRRAVCARRR